MKILLKNQNTIPLLNKNSILNLVTILDNTKYLKEQLDTYSYIILLTSTIHHPHTALLQ